MSMNLRRTSIYIYINTSIYPTVFCPYYDRRMASNHISQVLRIDAINAGDYDTCAILTTERWTRSHLKSMKVELERKCLENWTESCRCCCCCCCCCCCSCCCFFWRGGCGVFGASWHQLTREFSWLSKIESICWNQLTWLHLARNLCVMPTINPHIKEIGSVWSDKKMPS